MINMARFCAIMLRAIPIRKNIPAHNVVLSFLLTKSEKKVASKAPIYYDGAKQLKNLVAILAIVVLLYILLVHAYA